MFRSNIRDNHGRGNARDFLDSTISEKSVLRFVSAYFSIHAYNSLSRPLKNIEQLRFLFGEPHLSAENLGRDPREFRIQLRDDDVTLNARLLDRAIALSCADWLEQKSEIRSINGRLLHGKLYHVDDGKREHAMVGSSNFTLNGLGVHSSSNIETNLIVDSDRDRDDLRVWFDEIWNDTDLTVDVKDKVLAELRKLFENYSPEFIYLKTLDQIFGEEFDDASASNIEDSAIVNTEIWNKLYEFQKDGAKAAVKKLELYNGCIIADSVGLGKTYTALAIIKYYELRNKSVLVLCPKKLRENWTVYLAHIKSKLNPFPEDRFNYTVLSHTDLSRETGKVDGIDLATFNWDVFDLVVIDESHNFRNNPRGKYDDAGNLIRKSRYERLMSDVIQSGVKTQVLLLSATPVNNDLKDLRNQLYFITENSDHAFNDSLGITSLQDLLGNSQKTFAEWSIRTSSRDINALLQKLPSGLFKLLDALSIARSRTHIKNHYRDSIKELGSFPKRLKPISVYAQIDLKDQFLSYDRLNDQIGDYQLAVFNPTRFLKVEFAHYYDEAERVKNFTQAVREKFLIGMMKVNFLKRLESSVHSFAVTIGRTIERIEELEAKLNDFKAVMAEQEIDLEQLQGRLDLFDEDDNPGAAEVGGAKRFRLQHIDVDAWLEALREDRRNLNEIGLHAKDITPDRDAKLKELKTRIAKKATNPSTNKSGDSIRKVIVFTAFADTAAYLYDQIHSWASDELRIHSALVVGGTSGCKSTFGAPRFSDILMNFAPRAKERNKVSSMPTEGEIDILIATDCISEGQNLQDCDFLINYDIHWNPVRIIQRFGRIDRLGSLNESIQLLNFWPTEDLNRYINLRNRVEARMALVDLSATAEDNILDTDAIENIVADDMKYRDKQLLRLRDEVLDLEEFSESLVLNDFTLEDFRRELSNILESKQDELRAAPEGIFSLIPPNPDYPSIVPGVIFCLRDKEARSDVETVNPLQTIYLTYVKQSGEIAYGFAQAKQILDVFRVICLGQTDPYEKLCALFDNETNSGNEMSEYDNLLKMTVASLTSQFKDRNVSNLLSGRGGKLVPSFDNESLETQFELVTWLIIKSGEEYRAAGS